MELILQSRQFPDRLNDPLAIYTLREVYVSFGSLLPETLTYL